MIKLSTLVFLPFLLIDCVSNVYGLMFLFEDSQSPMISECVCFFIGTVFTFLLYFVSRYGGNSDKVTFARKLLSIFVVVIFVISLLTSVSGLLHLSNLSFSATNSLKIAGVVFLAFFASCSAVILGELHRWYTAK